MNNIYINKYLHSICQNPYWRKKNKYILNKNTLYMSNICTLYVIHSPYEPKISTQIKKNSICLHLHSKCKIQKSFSLYALVHTLYVYTLYVESGFWHIEWKKTLYMKTTLHMNRETTLYVAYRVTLGHCGYYPRWVQICDF